jgi:hypothetical protein
MPTKKSGTVSRVAPPKKVSSVVAAAPLSEAEQAFVAEYARIALAQGARRPPALLDEGTRGGDSQTLTFDPKESPSLFRARLAAATGSPLQAAQTELLIAVAQVHRSKKGTAQAVTGALAHMMDLAPRDGVEGMLAAQMVCVHRIAMELLADGRRHGQSLELAAFRLNQAGRLLRLFAMQLETLNRNRGKGPSEQKVTVQHVHVNDGGQAVVGSVHATAQMKSPETLNTAPTEAGGGDDE